MSLLGCLSGGFSVSLTRVSQCVLTAVVIAAAAMFAQLRLPCVCSSLCVCFSILSIALSSLSTALSLLFDLYGVMTFVF